LIIWATNEKPETPLPYSLEEHSEDAESTFLQNSGTHIPEAWGHKRKEKKKLPSEAKIK
jgi:hypothetical protein